MLRLLIALLAPVLLISCVKNNDSDVNGGDRVYYEYISDEQSFPQTNAKLVNKRVYYSLDADEVIWEQSNEAYMPYAYGHWSLSYSYSEAFSTGSHFVKIFSSSAIPTLYPHIANGVYFQKISKSTGAAEVSRMIVPASDLNTNDAFVISAVVTDGSNYYFACSNNFVYSFDGNGNLRWKKGGYPMGNLWRSSQPIGTGYSYIYYNDSKIFFISGDPTSTWAKSVYCLNATTGDLVWNHAAQHNSNPKQLMFHDAYVFDVGSNGYVTMLKKATGEYVETTNPPSGLPYYNIAKPIGKVNNSYAAYYIGNGSIGHIELAHPDLATITYLPGVPSPQKYVVDNGKVYTLSHGAGNTLELSCIDPMNGVQWTKNYTRTTATATFYDYEVYDMKIKNGKIYLHTSFHIVNGDCVPNEMKTVIPPNSYTPYNIRYPGVVVLSTSSGGLIKQSKKMPTGPFETKVYNLMIE
jgi:outer membrane protein assembly factor BamB